MQGISSLFNNSKIKGQGQTESSEVALLESNQSEGGSFDNLLASELSQSLEPLKVNEQKTKNLKQNSAEIASGLNASSMALGDASLVSNKEQSVSLVPSERKSFFPNAASQLKAMANASEQVTIKAPTNIDFGLGEVSVDSNNIIANGINDNQNNASSIVLNENELSINNKLGKQDENSQSLIASEKEPSKNNSSIKETIHQLLASPALKNIKSNSADSVVLAENKNLTEYQPSTAQVGLMSSMDFIDQKKNFHNTLHGKSTLNGSKLAKQDKVINPVMGEQTQVLDVLNLNVQEPKENTIELLKTSNDSGETLKIPSELPHKNDQAMQQSMPLNQFLLASQVGQNASKVEAREHAILNKNMTLDLSGIKFKNSQELISKISDYIIQSQVAGNDQLDLTVKHESLGQFHLSVSKNQSVNNQIDLQIMTSSKEGHQFFTQNETALIRSMQQSGINLGDVKVLNQDILSFNLSTSHGQSMASDKQSSSQAQHQFDHSAQKNSLGSAFDASDLSRGSERRKELWNEYRERLGA